MAGTVLLVEDELRIREVIADYFAGDGWNIVEAEHGEEALDLFDTVHPDLIILDIMMPHMDGFEVCRHIRACSGVPIILLTARSGDHDKVQGFELGADDYVTKPFSPKVLLARANSLMKRVMDNYEPQGYRLTFGKAALNTLTRRLELDGLPIELTPKEYELLLLLIRNKHRVISRDMILDRVWGAEFEGESRVVDSHIKKLRAKLGTQSGHIRTMIGVGYQFEL
ncbi:response regulator transcription factor [Paenibacillus sp. WLX1005]|uniref:response regulator transcription factor n=1 Tax=unclassified Paenibacillus TaxID=185978 RepID=UPI003983E699